MRIRSVTKGSEPEGATRIVGVFGENRPAPGAEEIVASTDAELLKMLRFEGKQGQTALVPTPGGAAMLVGLGDEAGFETVRAAIGNAVRAVRSGVAVTDLNHIDIDGATRAVVEGAALGSYQFRRYKTEGEPGPLEELCLVDADQGEIDQALVGAEATNLARDWVNTPALDMSPSDLADAIGEAASAAGLEVEVWDEQRIAEEKLGALLGVAAGSDRPPRLVILRHRPEGARSHLGLVGKGITFDSGGLSIKTAGYMEEMKDDMSGAAAVAAATIAMARLGLPLRVTTVTPLTDNAIGGEATRPGDVLRPVAGPTIEVLNTDAEGRLVLADGLGVIRRDHPDLIVDVATLTGAARVALGDKIGAVFGSDRDTAATVLSAAAARAGEEFWELPLFKEYRKALDSDVADIKNISGSRYGGAIMAAVFLSSFVGDDRWAHLDIAGPARARETSGEQVKGASGVAVRTLVELAREMASDA